VNVAGRERHMHRVAEVRASETPAKVPYLIWRHGCPFPANLTLGG
jgi:hypothetical protein